MPNPTRLKISPELRELIEKPYELEGEKDSIYIKAWNDLVVRYNNADFDEQYLLEPEIRRSATRVLYAGVDPKTIPTGDLLYISKRCPPLVNIGATSNSIAQKYADRIKGPLTGLRAYCVDCQGGVPLMVRECANMQCPHWPFRLGFNPFFGKLKDAEAESINEETDASEDSETTN